MLQTIVKLGTAAFAAVRTLGNECPRESALKILSTQALEFRDSAWIASGLLLTQVEGGIHLRLYQPDGQIKNELVLHQGDVLAQAISLKMTMAKRRFLRHAA